MTDENAPTLVHRFLHWEATQPDAPAFTQPYPDGSVEDFTWREVGDQARRMAAHLRSLQLPAQSNIAILGKNSAHWIMADLAIWMAGHVSVPLYPTLSAATAQFIFEHCGIGAVFLGKLDGKTDGWNEVRKVLPAGVHRIALPMSPPTETPRWEEVAKTIEPLQDVHLPAPADLATIIYTSGTTGNPKGVMHSFGNIMAYARGSREFSKLTRSERLLSYLPLAHAAERSFIESNWLHNGFHVYFSDCLETFTQDLRRARPTLFISMPRLWTKFYGAANAALTADERRQLAEGAGAADAVKAKILTMLGLQDVRLAFTGAAPLPAEIASWYRTLGLELLDVYGQSEDFAWSHYSRPGEVRLGYSGTALPGVERRIADNGEILIRSVTRMLGYYKEPELTAQAITSDGFVRTGDRGEVDELGRLRITGRVKEIFKTSKGKYVSPAPIENRFTHPKFEAVCVTGPGYPQPFALLLPGPGVLQQLDDPAARDTLVAELQALLDQVNATLEDHERLTHVVVVRDPWSIDNGFLTPTMKIKRSVIEERYLSKAQGWAELGLKVILE
jgi:long-subunit acyl-CoA synthetase (AMP-forming)